MTASRTAGGEAVAATAARGGFDAAVQAERLLDEVDCGLVVVAADDARVVYLNDTARAELDEQHPLQLHGPALGAQRPQDLDRLSDALASSRRGQRRLLVLGSGSQRVGVALVPLQAPAAERAAARGARAPRLVLLLLGRRRPCSAAALAAYAADAKLTPAETRVLELIAGGVPAAEIASRAGVAVSTVRTQIGGIRAKTGARSIDELVRQLALLPPMAAPRHAGDAAG